MNNLRKFANEADYSAATLNYPAVSWVVSGDTVHYDKTSGSPTPTVNDKVIIAAYDGSGESTMCFFNCEASSSGDITSITIDDIAVTPISCEGDYVDAEQTYIIKYGLNSTEIDDWFSGDLAVGAASTPSQLDVLIPSQITSIEHIPNNIVNLVVEVATPPTISVDWSGIPNVNIFVPDDAVNTYKAASGWSTMSIHINPISEYQGNLPV